MQVHKVLQAIQKHTILQTSDLSKSYMPQHLCLDVAQTHCFKLAKLNFVITGDALRHLQMNENVKIFQDFATSRCFVFKMSTFHAGCICFRIMGFQHVNIYTEIGSATYE